MSIYVTFSALRGRNQEIYRLMTLSKKFPEQNISHWKHIDVLDKHGNAVYLFMGAGDIQKYMNVFAEHTKKEETA